MLREDDVLHRFERLSAETLRRWIAHGWIAPRPLDTGHGFRDIDVARLRLVIELRIDMGLTEETVDTLLPLLDQVHELRRHLRIVKRAIERQPVPVRRRLAEAIQDLERDAGS